MSNVPYQPPPMSKRTRTWILSIVTALATGATTALLDYATARWGEPELTAAPLAVPDDAVPSVGAVEPTGDEVVFEKRGRLLGIKWAEKRLVDERVHAAAPAGPEEAR